MRLKNLFLFTILISIFPLISIIPSYSLSGQNNTLIAPVVVEVNGEPVYEAELLYFLIGRNGLDILGELIQDTILAQKASSFGIKIEPDRPKQEMTKYFGEARFKNLQNVFDVDKVLVAVKRNYLAEKVHDALVKKLLKDNGIAINKETKLQYYLDHLEDWSRPPLVKFKIIKTDTKSQAEAALAELKKGTEFGNVVTQYSTHEATKNKGGEMGPPIAKNTFSGPFKKLEDAAFDTALNQFSNIVDIEGSYFIIMPTAKLPKVDKKFNEVEQYIEGMLESELVEPYLEEELTKYREQSKIEILYPVFDVDESQQKGFSKVANLSPASGKYLIYPDVVKVNNENITEQEMLFFLIIGKGQEVLQELIGDMAISQQAKTMGISVDLAEADRILMDTFGKTKIENLEKSFDMVKVKNAIAREILAKNTVLKKKDELISEFKISVSESDALKWYENNPQRYSVPERVRFSILVTDKEDTINTAIREIQSGSDFASTVKKYSIDEKTKDAGGDIGTLWPRGIFFGPFIELEDKIFSLKINEISDKIFIQDRFYLVKLTEKKAEEKVPFAEVKEEITNLLTYYQVYPLLQDWLTEISNGIELDVKYPVFEVEKEIMADPGKYTD
jgi:foldase protein PrsA